MSGEDRRISPEMMDVLLLAWQAGFEAGLDAICEGDGDLAKAKGEGAKAIAEMFGYGVDELANAKVEEMARALRQTGAP